VEDKMENKLHTWQGKLLSYGGRLILLGSGLSNVPLYIVSLFELLKGTEKRCDIFRKCLLWLEKDGVRKYHLVKWEIVCMPQDQGGLGVADLRVMNFCLLCKWLWKLETTDGLWQQMIRAKYLKNKPLSQRVSKPSDSHFWQGVLKTAGTFTRCSRRLVGNGLRTLFWEDLQIGDKPLREWFPRLYYLTFSVNFTVPRF
jgi:hypothetical protein